MRFTKGKPFIWFLVLFIAIIAITPTFATTLRGNVYNSSLDKISNVVIVVDSDPVQRYVVKNGTYRFELPAGKYRLSARSFADEEQTLGTDVQITIRQEGSFVSDLVLKPINQSDEPVQEEAGQSTLKSILQVTDTIFIIAFVFLVSFLAWKFTRRKKSKNPVDNGFDENTNHLLNIVKSEKRVTQKELRRQFDLSEAKISLIISELEKKGIIKRVKKGRGNIVIYNGDSKA